MKRFFTFVLAAMLVGVSCSDPQEEVDSTPKGVVFASGTEMTVEFGSSGGSKAFVFTSDLDWEVTTSADWISVTPSSGTPSVKKFTVKASANDSFEERSGTVTMTTTDDRSYIIKVMQAAENETFTINSNGEYVVEAAGGEVEVKVKVKTNLEYTVEIPAEAKAWLSVADTRAVREETLTFTVAKNETFDERNATVELKGADGKVLQSIVFKQKGEEKVFDTDGEGNYVVEAAGGEVEVKVTTNLEYTVEIPAEAKEWLSVADTRAVREETLTFTVAKNETFDERSATVELKGADGEVLQSIVFKQKGEEKVFDTDGEGNYVVEAAGGEVEVKVTTNLEYTVEIPAEAKAWLSVADTRAVREETLTFTVAKNETFDERSATVKLKGTDGKVLQSIVFKQKSLDVILSLDKQEHLFFKDGGSVDVVVTTNIDFDIEIANGASSWLTCYNTRATKQEQLIVTASPMEGETFRSAEIRFKDVDGNIRAKFNVSQDSAYRVSYTTNNSLPLEVYTKEGFGATYLVNIYDYETGRGALRFDAPITAIPEQAFGLCENLTWIDLPEGITTIGASAFTGCTALEELTIPSTLTSLGSEAFKNCPCKATINCENVSFSGAGFTEVVIGDSVTTIGYQAFYKCSSLTSVTIPDSVTTIGERAFYSCDSLKSVTIPDSVTTIGNSAFDGCSRLTSVTIPDSVTTIGGGAFIGCISLTSVTIPDSVTTIGGMAFYYCSRLTSVTIGDSVTTIGNQAFRSCSSLTSVTIPDSVTTIGGGVFGGCSNLTEFKGKFAADGGRCLIKDNTIIAYANASGTTYTIPDSVTTIGSEAFSYCDSLTRVTIGDSVTTIGGHAFYDCASLTSVTIGDSVTTIGTNAFYWCRSLESVYCKATTPPTLGGSSVFNSNADGRKIYVPAESVEAYKAAENWSKYAADIVGYDFETGEEVAISNKLFYTATALVEPYDASAFNAAIVSNEWDSTTGEGVITFDGELTIIGDEAFSECSRLTSVTIGDSVTTIGDYAFGWCDSLTSVTIPDSVTTIGSGVFADCSNLAEFKGKFAENGGRCLIKDNTIIAYAEASGTTYTIPDGVTTIGDEAFLDCDSLTSVTIPDSVTSIGDYAFYNCDSLTSVTIGDSVTTIGDSAFYECYSLTSVTIPDSVTTIGEWAFHSCTNLTSVTIGDSVTTIGDKAFLDCDSLTSVTIGDSVTTIGDWAFWNCSSLTSVTIPDSVTTIGGSAFYDCISLTSVYCEATTPPTLGDSYVFDYNASGRKIYVPAESVGAYKAAKYWSEYAKYIVGYNFE